MIIKLPNGAKVVKIRVSWPATTQNTAYTVMC